MIEESNHQCSLHVSQSAWELLLLIVTHIASPSALPPCICFSKSCEIVDARQSDGFKVLDWELQVGMTASSAELPRPSVC